MCKKISSAVKYSAFDDFNLEIAEFSYKEDFRKTVVVFNGRGFVHAEPAVTEIINAAFEIR